jgi:hypothetical protein
MDNDIMKAYPSKEIAMAYLKKEPKRNKWISLRFNLRFKKNPASVGSGRVYSKISKHVVYTGFAKDLRIIIKSFF